MTVKRKTALEIRVENTELTGRMLNTIHDVVYEWAENAVPLLKDHFPEREHREINIDLAQFPDSIERSITSALEFAFYLQPGEEAEKTKGMAGRNDDQFATTVGNFADRMKKSEEYLKASLGQIDGVSKESIEQIMDFYRDTVSPSIVEGLRDMVKGLIGSSHASRARGTRG